MRIGVGIATTVALGALLAACGHHDTPPVMVNQQTLDDSVSHQMKDADPTMTVRLSLTAQQFADTVAASDADEIAAARLAQRRSTSPAITDFAARMIQAHQQSATAIRQAAANAQPALVPKPALSPAQQAGLTRLQTLTGVAFDRRYVRDQIEAHEAALAAMHDYAMHGGDPSLRDAAQQLSPNVQSHLVMAQNLPQP